MNDIIVVMYSRRARPFFFYQLVSFLQLFSNQDVWHQPKFRCLINSDLSSTVQ